MAESDFKNYDSAHRAGTLLQCEHCRSFFSSPRKRKFCSNRCAVLAAGKRYAKKHPEKMVAKQKLYRQRNREKVNAYQCERYKRIADQERRRSRKIYWKNPEKARQYNRERGREWRNRNPDKARQYSREWRKRNPGRLQIGTMPMNPYSKAAIRKKETALSRQRGHLIRMYGTSVVDENSKKLASFVFVGAQLARGVFKTNKVRSILNRIGRGETHACYE